MQEDNDLRMPLNAQNKFLHFILRNQPISKVAHRPVLICFALAATTFIALAAYLFAAMRGASLLQQEYSSACTAAACSVSFQIASEMRPPVYLLYSLEGFYQNHRRYIQSKSNAQLSGKAVSAADAAKVCTPYITNADLKVTKSWAGVALDPSALASPCGGIAYTFFNDSFSLVGPSGQQIAIRESGITWPGDKGGKYRRAENSNLTQWVDPENEHFIVWMRTAGLPDFKKLWGVVEQTLPPGQYRMTVTNNYQLAEWQGRRTFFLTHISPAGGRNYLLPVLCLLAGLASLAAVAVLWRKILRYRTSLE